MLNVDKLDMLDAAKADISLEVLREQVEEITLERDQYKKLYIQMLELCKKLEAGILPQKRERFVGDAQLTLSILGALLGGGEPEAPVPAAVTDAVKAHVRAKPTGRAPLPENLPHIDIEVLPPEVIEKGLEAFERIGEDVTETVERRPASLVVVRIHKPKFVFLNRDRLEDTKAMQGSTPELPIERGMAGPALMADTIVRRWQDHLPLHRLERIYGRDGLELPRSTVCGWHAKLSELVCPLIEAMTKDSFLSLPVHRCHGRLGAKQRQMSKRTFLGAHRT